MLTLEAARRSKRNGGRVEVFVTGTDLPLQLRRQPVFFELIGGEPADLDTLDFSLLALIHFFMARREPVHAMKRPSQSPCCRAKQ